VKSQGYRNLGVGIALVCLGYSQVDEGCYSCRRVGVESPGILKKYNGLDGTAHF